MVAGKTDGDGTVAAETNSHQEWPLAARSNSTCKFLIGRFPCLEGFCSFLYLCNSTSVNKVRTESSFVFQISIKPVLLH